MLLYYPAMLFNNNNNNSLIYIAPYAELRRRWSIRRQWTKMFSDVS